MDRHALRVQQQRVARAGLSGPRLDDCLDDLVDAWVLVREDPVDLVDERAELLRRHAPARGVEGLVRRGAGGRARLVADVLGLDDRPLLPGRLAEVESLHVSVHEIGRKEAYQQGNDATQDREHNGCGVGGVVLRGLRRRAGRGPRARGRGPIVPAGQDDLVADHPLARSMANEAPDAGGAGPGQAVAHNVLDVRPHHGQTRPDEKAISVLLHREGLSRREGIASILGIVKESEVSRGGREGGAVVVVEHRPVALRGQQAPQVQLGRSSALVVRRSQERLGPRRAASAVRRRRCRWLGAGKDAYPGGRGRGEGCRAPDRCHCGVNRRPRALMGMG
mmetsp:Transcript_49692/g.142182  ORF Transcript_49692/g.142182 Transcript_49692/m.142182 type:complete len:335 (-) Transcript_49692:37-1041(-)